MTEFLEIVKFVLMLLLLASPFLALMVFGFFVICQDRKREKLEEKKKLEEAKSH